MKSGYPVYHFLQKKWFLGYCKNTHPVYKNRYFVNRIEHIHEIYDYNAFKFIESDESSEHIYFDIQSIDKEKLD